MEVRRWISDGATEHDATVSLFHSSNLPRCSPGRRKNLSEPQGICRLVGGSIDNIYAYILSMVAVIYI